MWRGCCTLESVCCTCCVLYILNALTVCHHTQLSCNRSAGNAFLNDLVDADVLLHIVDVSGTTDEGGNLLVGDTR